MHPPRSFQYWYPQVPCLWQINAISWAAFSEDQRRNIMYSNLACRGYPHEQILQLITKAKNLEEEAKRTDSLAQIFGRKWDSAPFLSYTPNTKRAHRAKLARCRMKSRISNGGLTPIAEKQKPCTPSAPNSILCALPSSTTTTQQTEKEGEGDGEQLEEEDGGDEYEYSNEYENGDKPEENEIEDEASLIDLNEDTALEMLPVSTPTEVSCQQHQSSFLNDELIATTEKLSSVKIHSHSTQTTLNSSSEENESSPSSSFQKEKDNSHRHLKRPAFEITCIPQSERGKKRLFQAFDTLSEDSLSENDQSTAVPASQNNCKENHLPDTDATVTSTSEGNNLSLFSSAGEEVHFEKENDVKGSGESLLSTSTDGSEDDKTMDENISFSHPNDINALLTVLNGGPGGDLPPCDDENEKKRDGLSHRNIRKKFTDFTKIALKSCNNCEYDATIAMGLAIEHYKDPSHILNLADRAMTRYEAAMNIVNAITRYGHTSCKSYGELKGSKWIEELFLPQIKMRHARKLKQPMDEDKIFASYGRNVINFIQLLKRAATFGGRNGDEFQLAIDTLLSAIFPASQGEDESTMSPEFLTSTRTRLGVHHEKIMNVKENVEKIVAYVNEKEKLSKTYKRCQEELTFLIPDERAWKDDFETIKDVKVHEVISKVASKFNMSPELKDNLCLTYKELRRTQYTTHCLTEEANGNDCVHRFIRTQEDIDHELTIDDLVLTVKEMPLKGVENPFAAVRGQKERIDNVDTLIHQHMHAFCHDDEYTRVDSNNSKTYKSRDWNGRKNDCSARHWIDGGDDIRQLKLFIDSVHYTNLCKAAKLRSPEYFSDDKLPTVSLMKFQKFTCVCIRKCTHDACVDVICDTVESRIQALSEYVSTVTSRRRNLSFFHEKFQRCSSCAHNPDQIATEDNWINLLKLLPESHGDLLKQLCDKALCPLEEHEDLTLPSEDKPFKLRSLKCSMGECPDCSFETKLPFNCDALKSCQDTVLCWEWDHLKEGDNQRTPTKKPMPVSEVFGHLRGELEAFVRHSFHLRWQKRVMKLDQECFGADDILFYTDYASGIDMKPDRSECCAHDEHAVLLVLVAIRGREIVELKRGGTVDFIKCDHWFCVVPSEGEGKMSDWMTHGAVVDHILNHYINVLGENYSRLVVWTDNCPPQYKNRQNFFQLALLMVKYRLDIVEHRFACIYGFKGVWDALGKTVKKIVCEFEAREKFYVFNAYDYYIVLRNHFAKTLPCAYDWKTLKEEGSHELEQKGTMSAINRFICYGTDDKEEYNQIIANPTKTVLGDNSHEVSDPLLNGIEDRIIYLNRSFTKKNQDTTPVPNTNANFHFKIESKDITEAPGLSDKDHQAIATFFSTRDGTFPLRSNTAEEIKSFLSDFRIQCNTNQQTNQGNQQECKYCKLSLSPASFLAHEIFCCLNPNNKVYKIQVRTRPCSCVHCRGEDVGDCKYKEVTGAYRTHDMMKKTQRLKRDGIQRALNAYLETTAAEKKQKQHIIAVLNLVHKDFPSTIPSTAESIASLPSFESKANKISADQMKSITKFLKLVDIIGTGANRGIKKRDRQRAIIEAGGWKAILDEWSRHDG